MTTQEKQQSLLTRLRVPRTIQWLVRLFSLYLFIFTGFRVATVFFFKPSETLWLDLVPAFWLGLKYDLRWISFILLPIAVFSIYTKFSPYYSEQLKRFWTYYLGLITLLVFFFYGADFGQFAYVSARLNADALIFAEDPRESLKMVWQSYPVVWILIGLVLSVAVMTAMFKRIHVDVQDRNSHIHKFSYRRRWHAAAIFMLLWFMYGFLSLVPLNFYRAFSLNDEFKSNLALNPFQNFFTTLRFREPDRKTAVSKFYPVMSDFLRLEGVASSGSNRFARTAFPGSHAIESNPNVVLVLCESFSMYKSTMSGNQLNATPYFDSLCRSGIFFERCFSPSFGTARGVFATLTGIPDVQLSKFSTRNEESVKQRVIINDLEEYDKLYFLGGRSDFNNLKGLVKNIRGVDIYEQGRYRSPVFNVWGISDKDLFSEANQVLAKKQKPFFAIIQTAGNHRPFEVPEADKGLIPPPVPEDTLRNYGFESQKEYEAFRYFDRCIAGYMEAARREEYFRNTIFVFIGDHAVEGNASFLYPDAWTKQRLSELHVPLLFYSPYLLTPEKRSEVVSQVDVLPTIAGLAGQAYTNSTIGRDLLSASKGENLAFIIQHASGWIGVLNDDYLYRRHLRINKQELVPIRLKSMPPSKDYRDSVMNRLSELSRAIYETSRYLLLHNRD